MKLFMGFLLYVIILIALFTKFPILMLGILLVLAIVSSIMAIFFNYDAKEGEFDDKY